MDKSKKRYIYNVLTSIITGEVTIIRDDYTICMVNKWHRYKTSIEIEYKVFQILNTHDIMEHTSGNFETGEQHYILDREKLIKKLKDGNDEDSLFVCTEHLKHLYRDIEINNLLN